MFKLKNVSYKTLGILLIFPVYCLQILHLRKHEGERYRERERERQAQWYIPVSQALMEAKTGVYEFEASLGSLSHKIKKIKGGR